MELGLPGSIGIREICWVRFSSSPACAPPLDRPPPPRVLPSASANRLVLRYLCHDLSNARVRGLQKLLNQEGSTSTIIGLGAPYLESGAFCWWRWPCSCFSSCGRWATMAASTVRRRYSSISPKALVLRLRRPTKYLHASDSLANSSRTRELSRPPLRSGGSCGPSCRRMCSVS